MSGIDGLKKPKQYTTLSYDETENDGAGLSVGEIVYIAACSAILIGCAVGVGIHIRNGRTGYFQTEGEAYNAGFAKGWDKFYTEENKEGWRAVRLSVIDEAIDS